MCLRKEEVGEKFPFLKCGSSKKYTWVDNKENEPFTIGVTSFLSYI